jgi:hypothetical protein
MADSAALWVCRCLLFLFVLLLPLADEILAGVWYARLCGDAGKVSYLGSIEAGPEFFSPNGKSKWITPSGEISEMRKRLVTVDSEVDQLTPFGVRITRTRVTYREAETQRILAHHFFLTFRGGWLSRMLEGPIVMPGECGAIVSYGEVIQNVIRMRPVAE